MMVSTKGLCATIALMCVIVPIIIGHCMPVGESEHTGYATDNRVNITSDLLNDSTTIYQTIISDYNNYPFISFNPISTSSTASTIPAYTETTSVTSGNITPASITELSVYSRTNDPFTVTYDGTTYTATRITIIPDMYMVCLYRVTNQPVTTIVIPAADFSSVTITCPDVVTKYTFTPNGSYVDPSSGAEISSVHAQGLWVNGYDNSRVGFIFEKDSTDSNTQSISFSVSSGTDSTEFILYNSGGSWNLNPDPDTTTDIISIPDAKQVYLEVDALKDEYRLSTLVHSDRLNVSPEGRIINTVSCSMSDSLDHIRSILAWAGSMHAGLCWDADISAGTQAMISNNTLSINSYYPSQTAMIEFSGVAFYGDSLLLPGFSQAAAVSDGKITYDDVNGDSHTTKIRESVLVCEYIGNGLYDVYYDDNQIGSGVAVSDMDITFNGNWLMNVYAYPASEYTYSQYDFDFTTLNVDHNEYCFIGMATAIFSFVIAAFIGKRSGGKATWCLLISALGFAIYFGLMDL